MSALPPTYRRCEETRAHYAHEWYSPLRNQCPGGPDETAATPADNDLPDEWPGHPANLPKTASISCLAAGCEQGDRTGPKCCSPLYPEPERSLSDGTKIYLRTLGEVTTDERVLAAIAGLRGELLDEDTRRAVAHILRKVAGRQHRRPRTAKALNTLADTLELRLYPEVEGECIGGPDCAECAANLKADSLRDASAVLKSDPVLMGADEVVRTVELLRDRAAAIESGAS